MTTKNYQQLVFDTAKACGLNDEQARLIVAQAQHESADFTSHVFNTDNNLFGMKVPSVRSKKYIAGPSKIIRASEGATPYAHYDSVSNSVKDLILSWHAYNKTDWTKIHTAEQYAAYLKSKGYYGDSEENYYTALVRKLKALPESFKLTASILPLFIVAAIAIYFLTKN